MDGEPFAVRWERRMGELAPELPVELVTHGDLALPRDAAPFLSFDRFADQPRLWQVFGIPEHWPEAARGRVAPYRMVGSDGAGNPLCLDPTGAVWLLDHEDHFRTTQFVNSGVPQLAECLLAFFGERDPDRFRAAARAVDPPALVEGAFWWCEAAGLEPDGG